MSGPGRRWAGAEWQNKSLIVGSRRPAFIQVHFMHNSLFSLADDVGLLPVIGLPSDCLHWILLGLFGYHFVRAIIYLLLVSKTIVTPAYLTEHGNRKALVNQSTSSHDILRRLARRLSRITEPADESCLTTREKFAHHSLKV